MNHDLFSEEWAVEWVSSINHDTEYQQVGRKWNHKVCFNLLENGDVISSLLMDLQNGSCTDWDLSHQNLAENAAYVFEAEIQAWETLINEQRDPIYAIMSGFIKLRKGTVLSLSKHTKAGKRLLQLCPGKQLVTQEMKQQSDPIVGYKTREVSFKSTTEGLDFDSFPMQLFQKAKTFGIWNPTDIDFSHDVSDWQGLNADEKEIITHLTALFVAGEESVTSDILPLLSAVARDGYLEDEIYLTSFLWEEAKHTEFFARFLDQVGINGKDLNRFHSPNYRTIFYEELPKAMESLYSDYSPEAQVKASVTYNMIVEGTLAETGYQAYYKMLDEADIMPGLKEGIGHLKRDESRHIAYGLYLIGRHLQKDPDLMHTVHERMEKLVEPAIGFINEIFDYYQDQAPFGLQRNDFIDYAMNQFTKRMAKLELIASEQGNPAMMPDT
jgi:ribonucleoside-diphosphate reductase beta chain